LVAVSEAVKGRLNPAQVADIMSTLGQIYTNFDKTVPTEKFHKFSEIQFLKRGFRVEPLLDRHVAPLDLNTIRESILWTKRGQDSEYINKTTFATMIQELAFHGKGTYERECAPLLCAFEKAYGYSHFPSSWKSNLEAATRMEDGFGTGFL
jgi:hypothetical protein